MKSVMVKYEVNWHLLQIDTSRKVSVGSKQQSRASFMRWGGRNASSDSEVQWIMGTPGIHVHPNLSKCSHFSFQASTLP